MNKKKIPRVISFVMSILMVLTSINITALAYTGEGSAFEQSVTVDGVEITISADEGVFPEGATVTARKVTDKEENEVSEAIDDVRDEAKNVAASYTFDIAILNKDGNEIEPDTTKAPVKVSFKMAEIANENLETNVYHVVETADGLDAMGMNTLNDSVNQDAATASDTATTSDAANDEVTIETTGFSFYTVEFTYGELQYVLDGGKKVDLAAILNAVGIKANGNITEVIGSNDELFKPVLEDGVWYVEAVNAFGSEEWLKVTIDGIAYEIAVTDDQTVTNWTALKNAFNGTGTSTIVLGADINAASGDSTLVVSGTKTLDLNGYVINANRNCRVISVGSGATLNIYDSGSTREHYFGADTNEKIWTLLNSKANGCKTVTGGCITGGYVDSYSGNIGGGGILVSAGTVNMYGGNIVGNWLPTGTDQVRGGGVSIEGGGTFNLYDGSIIGNTVKKVGSDNHPYGGGIYVNGTFIMKGGRIAENYGGYGGGIASHDKPKIEKIEITGGTIENNTSLYSGGGIFACGNIAFTMSDCIVQNNLSHYIGGGICIVDNMTGNATITGNTKIANNVAVHGSNFGHGGGVAMYGTDIVISGNVEITGNKADDGGGGVALWDYKANICTIGDSVKIYGNYDNCTITNDVVTGNGEVGNIYVESKSQIALGSGDIAPKEGMIIGVSLQNGAGNVTPVDSNTTDYYNFLVSDDPNYVLVKDTVNKNIKLVSIESFKAINDDTGEMFQSVQAAINDSDTVNNHTIRLIRSSTEDITVSKNITLDLYGNVLKGTGTKSVVTINSGVKLTLEDSNKYVENKGDLSADGVWTWNSTSGTTVIKGGIITGGGGISHGGGVQIRGGSLVMNGGTIAGNKATNSGGGICVGCSADTGITTPSEFIMNGGAVLYNNGTSWGGGVCVGSGANSSSTFTMNAGKISNNTAYDGGGIHIGGSGSSNTFNMLGGEISNNKSTGTGSNGGGGVSVYLYNETTKYNFVMTGGSITDNAASAYGAGVNIRSGSGTLSATLGGTAKIDGNKLSNGTNSNLYLLNNKTINIGTGDIAPKSGMSVGVTTAAVPTETTPVAITTTNVADYRPYFTSDNSNYVIKNVNNVLKLSVINDCTIKYANGIYNGFAPYWKVGNAPADDKLVYNSTMTLPENTSFTNVGYKLAGWTTVKPTGSSATKEYDAGASLNAAQVNALYNKCTDDEITLYAIWERDLTQIAWNADMDKVYNSEETYVYTTFNNRCTYNQPGAKYALGAAISLMSAANQTVYVLQDADIYIGAAANSEMEFKMNNSTLDGGIYSAQVSGDTVTRSSGVAPKDTYSGFSSDEKVRKDNVDNRYTVNRVGESGGHAIQTKQSQLTMKNLVFTYNGTSDLCNGFFAITPDVAGQAHSVTLENIKLSNFISGTVYPMFLARSQSVDTYTLVDCEITNNTTGTGSVFYVGNFAKENGTTKLVLKGNTIISGNTINGTPSNLVVNTAQNLTIADDFSGTASVYLPSSGNMIAVLCSTEDRAKELLDDNSADGTVTSDQGYRLTAELYDGKGAIRVAKPAKISFNANNPTTGSIPASVKVGDVDTPITSGVIDVYYGDKVEIPGAGTMTKPDFMFKGWNTKADGTGTNYTEGTLYTVNADNLTLYANWKYIIADVTHEGVVTSYESLQAAINAATAGDKVRLLQNTKENVTVGLNKNFILDLNGNVLQGTGSGIVVTINNGANLEIIDSNSGNKTHYFTVDSSNLWKWDDTKSSGAKSIDSMTARANAGDVIAVSGGCITGGYTTSGSGININAAKLTMNGGNIVGNNSTGTGICGAVYLTGSSTVFKMNDGRICGNVVRNCGGGVEITNKSLFELNGGLISDNYGINNNGSGVQMDGGSFTMTGGLITRNSNAHTITSPGGAVHMWNGTFKMIGGTVTGNTSADAMDCGVTIGTSCTATIGGTAKITGNSVAGAECNLCLYSNTTINLATDALPEATMLIGVTTVTNPTVTTPVSITGTNTTDYSAYFTSDNANYTIKYNNNCVKLMVPGTISNATPKADKNTNKGYIEIDKTSAFQGETVTVTVTPDAVYSLKSLKYNDGTDHDITAAKSFTMPYANVTVKAEFEHIHSYTFVANDNVVTATCVDGCPSGYDTTPFTLTLIEPSDLVYDAKAKKASISADEITKWTGAGFTTPDIVYEAKSGSALTDGYPVNVGDYIATITVDTDKTAKIEFAITKANSSITTKPTAKSPIYNGSEQALVTEGEAANGTMNYAIGSDVTTAPDAGWSDKVPTGKNVGTYYVWYKSVGDSNHTDTEPVCVTINIAPKEITVSGITAINRDYEVDNSSATLVFDNVTLDGKVDGDDLSVTATGLMEDDSAGVDKKVTIMDLTLTGNEKDNYVLASDGHQTETTVTINKVPSGVTTAPLATTPIYNGSNQALVTEGVAANGTMNYAIGSDAATAPDAGWTGEVPTGKNVGTYYVWYKCVGDSNHTDTEPVCVTIDIAPKEITVSGITAINRDYEVDNSSATLVFDNVTLDGKVDGDDLSVTATGLMDDAKAGENKFVAITRLELTGEAVANYKLADGGQQESTVVTIYKLKYNVTAPKALKLEENGEKQVLITAGTCDNGIIVYSLDNIHFTSDVEKIAAKAAGKYTVYYKVEGNENYEEYAVKKIEVEISAKPTPTPAPDPDPTPTPAPTPTPDPEPTPTPNPTPTPEPTPTPTPTPTPAPTPAPAPTSKSTEAPEPEKKEEAKKVKETKEDKATDVEEEYNPDAMKDATEIKCGELQHGKGYIYVALWTSEKSPVQNAGIANKLEDLINDSKIFTKEEIAKIEDGTDARIWINITDIDISSLDDKDIEKLETEANKMKGDNVKLIYLDISLFKQVGNCKPVRIHEPEFMLNLDIELPEALLNTNPHMEREYCVLRLHDGEVSNLGGTFDAKKHILTISTDKFSTYVLSYADTSLEEAKTSMGLIWFIIILLLLIIIAITIYVIVRNKDEKNIN